MPFSVGHFVLAPAAHDADAGLDRGAGQIGELLTRQRHRNRVPASVRPPHIVGELQKQPREPRFDPSAGHFRQPVRQLDQPLCQPQQQPAHE